MTNIKGSGGGGCFVGSTRVSTPEGYKEINAILEGDIVLSFDDQGKIHEAKVLKVHHHEEEEIWWFKFWGGESFTATPNHWVLNQFNAFVEVGTLEEDDCVINQNNHLVPLIEKKKIGLGTVFNLTVEGQHTFIAENIRVHNAGLGAGIKGSGGGGGGGKGGGGSSHTPTEADDTLQSVQVARVLDLLCEGPIEGIVNGVKGIYLNGTPVQSAGGSSNFTGYSVETLNGSQGQGYIRNSSGVETEKNVNVEITNATSVIRQITNTEVDRVRVTISIPSLRKIEDDGDIIGNDVRISMWTQSNGGGYVKVRSDEIRGKASNSYKKDYMITLSGAFPHDIKLVRDSDDLQTTRDSSATFWSSYTEIIDEKLKYPNSALAFLKFDSRNFSGVPERRYDVKGLKVRLPSNASVNSIGAVSYSGTWNGSFGSAQWCADPAWCLYDLMTDTRYGASIPESSIDKWDFYTVSKYCNEGVPDGIGGNEPRFSLNLHIVTRDEIFNVINELTSVFRGMAYYSSGSLVLNQDSPSDSQYLLGPSNVVDGRFEYSGTSQKARHTTITVSWHSYDKLGEINLEYVEDADAIAKYGVINKDIKGVGCYSQGQAHRLGKWALLSEQNLTETVTFQVAIDSGIILSPGMVIDIADPVKSGKRRAGRISSVTSTSIFNVDSDTDFSSIDLVNDPVCSIILPSGLVEKKDVQSISGTQITLTSALSETPLAQGVWMIETNDIQYQQFRVISVTEGNKGVYAVTALMYNSSIYDAVDEGDELTQRDITNLTVVPEAVTSVSGSEYLYQDGQNIKTAFDLSWVGPRQAVTEYRIGYQLNDNNWIRVITTSPSYVIKDLKVGTLRTEIQAYNYLGFGSHFSNNTFTLLGKTAVPEDVTNLTFEDISPNSGRLRWDQTTALDVKVAGKIHIRHSSLTDGSGTWNNSVDLIDAIAGASTEVIIPKLTGETLVKFADDSGNFSTNATSIVIQTPAQKAETLLVKNQREDQISPTPFTGSKTNTEYDAGLDALQLTSSGGNINATGSYTFADTLDLGGVFALDVQRYFVTRGVRPSDLIDVWPDIDARSDWDGTVIDDVNASLSIRATNDNPSSSPTWGSWVSLKNGTFSGRGFQVKTDLTSADTTENILIDQLGYEARFDQRTEHSNGVVASTTSAKTITFTKPFWTGTSALGGSTTAYLPSVSVIVHGLSSGDYIDMGTVTGTQFTVTLKNSSGSAINKNFSWTAVGYGRGA